MKQPLFFMVIMAICLPLFGQVPNCNAPTPYNEEAYSILKNLDKSQVPTGILYENVFPFADLERYNASYSTDTSNLYHFFQAYSEVYRSSYDNSSFVHPSDLQTAIENFTTNKDYHHPVGLIDYNYNSLDPNSIANNLLYAANGQLFDVAGRSQSPYLSKRTFVSSVLQTNSVESFYDGIHYFYFSPSFIFSNRGTQLSSYQYIEFYLDGVWKSRTYINGNNSLTVGIDFPYYEGESTLTLVYHRLTGEDEVARVKLNREAQKNLVGCNGSYQLGITGDSFDGGYGDATYCAQGRGYFFWADGNCSTQQLKKTVIFVDGFDPNNGRNAWTIWNKRVNKEIDDVNGNKIKFGDELRSNGYDVIIYDYDEDATNRGGGGFVENNGIAFVKFLQTIYNQHQSTLQQDFIVVAPSMAALVVRYGLAWAEHNNIAHHVGLYISFDGPHQGAHVTAGIQQMVDIFTQYGGLKQYENVKNSVHQTNAAKQMLINHSSQESETGQAHPYRQQFLTNLNAVGNYPQNLRKVAISDGNRFGILKNATDNGFEPCDPMFEMKIKQRLGFCNSCDKLSIATYAQTDGSRCQTLNFKVHNNALVLRWLSGNTSTQEYTFYSQPAFISRSYDKAPGGMFGTEADFEIKPWQKVAGYIFTGALKLNKNLIPKSTFVPTISSVDYTFPNNEPYEIYRNFQGITLSKCAGTTPFDTVYALQSDFNHARIDAGLLEVFRNEIYSLKPKSVCAGDCPEYVTLNTPLSNGTNFIQTAQKAIFIEPNFNADAINTSIVFAASIGCNQTATVNAFYNLFKKNQLPNISTNCSQDPLTWDTPTVVCNGNGTSIFTAMVKNLDINTYAEFSIDGSNWQRANLFDRGFVITLPNQTNPQIFFARPKNIMSQTIYGWLGYCSN